MEAPVSGGLPSKNVSQGMRVAQSSELAKAYGIEGVPDVRVVSHEISNASVDIAKG
jgi:hypothetical protein